MTAPTHDGEGKPIDLAALYYIEDARQIVGNCMMFWGVPSGYDCELDRCRKYTGAEIARAICRTTDVPWRVEHIEAHVVRHVRRDMLRRST